MLDQINKENVPRHIAVIMDGNGRWAQKKGAMRVFGHKNAIQAVRDVIEASDDVGAEYLTLYTFSTENWSRPQYEVNAIMELVVHTVMSEMDSMMANNVRLVSIGDRNSLPGHCKGKLEEGIAKTAHNTGLTVILALSYSGRWDIQQAMKGIAEKVANKEIEVEAISQELIASHLCTAEYPDPELLVRTSGEYRISNFLLWQMAYTELYFTDVLWPDFRKVHLYEAVLDFQRRERRFGKTGAQVKS
ncbi:UDP pyrophosphate synthase [Nitritalea halalkaliphila LW7]|uniref:Isoprenyl transferase n=1 Tax=Nitritalea halalkaliphila LW7 TaxID=1189621 RepID=I5BWE0_9BACT|nr:isoprenyl transferase [Nitritalea halalkaliphila]EIM73892.1 UDP pyrophosphate synthase [Nitritalea halalkaliphila LW7]